MELRGLVRPLDSTPAIRMESVRLLLMPVGSGLAPGAGSRAESPGTQEWLEAHGLRGWPRLIGKPDETGRFALTVPQIDGMHVVADAPGWRTAAAPLSMTGDSQDVELVLKRGIRLGGVVRSSEGLPLEAARVVVYVTVTGDYAGGDPGRIRILQPSGGLGGERNLRTGKSRTTLHSDSQSDAAGKFLVVARIEGEARILVYAPGYRPLDMPLGAVSQDVVDLRLELEEASDAGVVAFRYGSLPLTGIDIVVGDLSGGVGQPGLTYHPDEAGAVSADWFVAGKLYTVIAMGENVPDGARAPRFIRWNGERDIDLATLPQTRP